MKGSGVDETSVHNIWHNTKQVLLTASPSVLEKETLTRCLQAWAGIDNILPTGGRYGYEDNHYMPADGAKLMDFMHHAKKEIARMEKKLPAGVPQDEV